MEVFSQNIDDNSYILIKFQIPAKQELSPNLKS